MTDLCIIFNDVICFSFYSEWEELRLIKRFFLPVKRIVKESF